MKRYWLLALIIITALLAACRRDEDNAVIAAAATFAPPAVQARPVTLSELDTNPTAFRDTLIQITGAYQPLPNLICAEGSPRYSPAGWYLVEDSLSAPVAGFEEPVQRLVPVGTIMTVEGLWRFWEGSVGCGKWARTEQIWYLQATNIISPAPFVRASATPPDVAGLPLPTIPAVTPAPGTPTGSPEPGTTPQATPTAAPSPQASPTPGTAGTPVAGVPSPTPTAALTVTLSATPTIENGDEATPTPGNTPEPGTTSTNTPAPGEPIIVDQDPISSFYSLFLERLDSQTQHRYTFDVVTTMEITLTLVMPADANPAFRLLDPNGNTIVDQDASPAGEAERLNNYSLITTGTYELIIREATGRPADYTFTIGQDNALYFAGLLQYGESGTGQLQLFQFHYWHFSGQVGDTITVRVVPVGDADFIFEIFTPTFDCLYSPGCPADYGVDLGGQGDPEEFTFELPDTGLYTIEVLEYYADPAAYEITLTRE